MENEVVLNENVETEEFDNTFEEAEVYEEPEESGGGLLVGVGILALVGAAGAAALHFTKKKREEMTVRNLEKKGYTVIKPEVVEDDEEDFEDADHVD